MDRADAIIVGASIEGLASAAMLARAGRRVLVLEREPGPEHLVKPEPAYITQELAAALGLAPAALVLADPPAHVAIGPDQALVVWPDAAATARALEGQSPRDASAWPQFCAMAGRVRASWGGDAKALDRSMLAAMAPGAPGTQNQREAGRFWQSSLGDLLDAAFDNPLLKGLIAALAVQQAPIALAGPGSAALLLAPAMGAINGGANRWVQGGAPALIRALINAFTAAGGAIQYGCEVSEILLEREAAAGVAIAGKEPVKAPCVIAGISPRHVIQGLLHTRKTILPAFRQQHSDPAGAALLARLYARDLPPGLAVDSALLIQGAVLHLGPSLARMARAAHAFERHAIHDDPMLSLTFYARGLDPALGYDVLIAAPFLPQTLAEGPWSSREREKLASTVLKGLERSLPGWLTEDSALDLIRPAERRGSAGATAIVSDSEPPLESGQTVAWARVEDEPFIQGVYVPAPHALLTRAEAGCRAAYSVLGSAAAKKRAAP